MFSQDFYDENINWILDEVTKGVENMKRGGLYAGIFADHIKKGVMPKLIRDVINKGAKGLCIFSYDPMHRHLWASL